MRIKLCFFQIFILFCVFLFPVKLAALDQGNELFPYHVNYITNDEGLPQNTVHDIFLDRYGFIWFGTGNGLARYDGYSVTTFEKDRFTSNFINALAGTPDSRLWVGTKKGLSYIDLTNNKSYEFELQDNSDGFLTINTLFVDRANDVWVGTAGNGIFLLKKSENKYHVTHYNYNEDRGSFPPVNAFTELESGLVLTGTQNGILTIDKHKGFTKATNEIPAALYTEQIDVRSLFIDSGNKLWAGGFSGLMTCQLEEDSIQWYYPDNEDEHALIHGTVHDIISDQFGTIYIGTLGGLEIYNPETDGFIHFPQEGPDDFKLNNRFVHSLLADEKGNIWVGTEKGGINHFNLYQKPFYFLTNNAEDDNSLSAGPINSIFRDGEVLWIGTAGGGLNKIGPEADTVQHFRNDPEDENSLSNNFVSAIEKDDDKEFVWVGTWGTGLNKFKGNGTFEHFLEPGEVESDSVSNSFVSSLLYDERGFLLIGTEGTLALLNTETEEVISLGDGPLSQITEIGCLLKDHKGFFWVGTRNGLFRFPAGMLTPRGVDSSVDGGVTKFTSLPSKKNNTVSGLAGDYVISLTLDRDDNIWAGTYGNGVSCIRQNDNNQWVFTNYGVEEGLCNDVIYGILEDQNGRLWMSTDQGLSRFEKSDSTFLNYYTEDGLLSNQFYWSAAHKSDDGFLYFGNVKGLNYFNPRRFPDYPFKTQVVISGLRVFNRPVETGKERHNKVVLSRNIFLTDTVSLSYKDNVITFEFSAIDYFHPRKIRYAYKLSGVDKEWIEVSNDQRLANYTNLDGGTYHFRVKATNSEGEWDDNERVLTLIIRPPFWQTTWFKLVLMGLIVSLALLYARHHARRLRMQKRRLENMVQERTHQIEEQKNQLKDQAMELSRSNQILEQRQKLIEGQKNQLESKNSKILDQRNHLIALNKKVKAANQSKLRFFTNVSHEFRTPLTLILAPLENLLEDDSLPPYVKDTLKTVNRNARRLLILVNQLLTFRKMEAGKSSVHVARGNAEQFLQEIYQAFSGLARDRDITFNARFELLPKEVWFDGEKLENIVYNLLSNAFKYSPVGGEVGFYASVEKQNDIQQLIISISDSGPGIPKKNAEKVFDRFYRAEEDIETDKGSGIGLAFAKELAQAMHGDIELKSDFQQGTTFVVSLPCSQNAFSKDELAFSNQEVTLSEEMKEKVQVIRDELTTDETVNNEYDNAKENRSVVLVVEDNRELGNLIKQSLENTYDVLEAENGREAYEIAKKNNVDLVISDIMMPEMDGISLCDNMKKNIYTSHIPVILLSARTLVKHQLEGLKTGADDYIGKPFSMRILKEKARNLIESRKKLRALFSNGTNNEEVATEDISSIDQQFIDKAYQILEEHFSNPDFNVEGFADLMFVSRSLLYKKIKALTGLSPNDFIMVYRLKKSISYLNNRNLSINEVAFKAGFNDPKYFSRVFKKFYHKTPSEFIK